MNFYIVSPNASNSSKEEAFWKALIEKEEVALIGWDSSNKFGKMFTSQVLEGDFILIAQGSNANKALYLGGVVAGPCEQKVFPNAPRSIFYRKLNRVIGKTALDSLFLNFKGSAYGEAAQIPAIYQLKPDSNSIDLEIVRKLKSLIPEKAMRNINTLIPLLKYKKQIILQGPPGTGKTRLAKRIASELTGKEELAVENIAALIKPGLVISSSTNYTEYTVLSITDSAVQVQLKNEGRDYYISFKDIQRAYKIKLWEGGQKNGSDPYAAAIAKFINEHLVIGNVKLIQFHPAYSYEDFVRGIVVETDGGNPSYRSINKIFAELAEVALQNYNDSQKQPEEVSKEKLLENYLNDFKEDLATKIDESEEGKLMLQGTSTYLFQVEEDAVRYVGENWKRHSVGLRLLFSDIKILYLSDAKTRKDVTTNPNISSLSRSHASYTLRVLDLFKAFMNGKSLIVNHQQKIDEIPFVLIIDEVNRANLPSVLGELIYGLEYRGEPIESMYEVDGDRKMIIPPNLYVIGTMNTADRSVGHIDYAIRRRFAFVDVLPSTDPILNPLAKHMFENVSKLFVSNYAEVISDKATPKRAETLMADFKPEDVWIGHSYFLTDKADSQTAVDEIKIKMKYEVLPLLKEYVKDGILRSNEDISDDPVQKVIQELDEL
ncbi:DNA polymerase III delta prime subunit [Algoriphagus sp. 4150]|uniref:AAA family ATPase n=1 Tax=Algoriphagus sp. 4150 TaxID=2817756 RepID=UPI002861AF00|nr:AAA family ATPase [Algoriphagus sp. 4150]MDR7128086.1 DNA polymerase III delta prime subunit [Algoriphagus sp. 4150]